MHGHSRLLPYLLAASAALPLTLLPACSSAPATSLEDRDDVDDAKADGGKKGETPAGPIEAGPPLEISVLPGAVYSGFDGTHPYQLPVSVYGAKGVTLTTSDPAAVVVEPAQITDPVLAQKDKGESFLLTMKRAGSFTLEAKSGTAKASATITVSAYSLDRYAAGQQRYQNDSASGQACAGCHSKAGGPDHSPTALASAKDNEVATVITTGILREGNPIRGVQHRWQVTETELDGLVTYLRALPPRGYAKR